MRPPKFRAKRSNGRRVTALLTFFLNFNFFIFDHVTVIGVLICCDVPNFIKIGSRVWPPDARNCWMFNAALLGNGLCHGNYIMADMSGTWWNATTQVSSKSVDWEASYGISNVFQHLGHNLLLYTKFHQNLFTRFVYRRPWLQNVQCAVARQRTLPWQPRHGGHVGNMMGCDHPSFVPVGPLVGELWHFQYFPTWRPAAILNFKNFNIWSRDCQCGFNLLLCTKFHQNWFIGMSNICLWYPQWKARPLIKKALLRDGRAFF